ncbi:MAG: HD domain-containing protein [Candidatus Geothermincolia bacterium]
MTDRRLSLMRTLSLVICAGVLVFAATRISISNLDLTRTVGLMAILAFAEAFRIRFPWGRPMRLGMAVMLAVVALRPLPEVLWIFFIGSMAGRLLTKMSRMRKGDFYHIIQRTYLVAVAGLVYHFLINLGANQLEWRLYLPQYSTQYPYHNPAVAQRALMFPLAFLALALVYYVGEMITSALETGAARAGNWKVLLPHQMRKTVPVYAALAASGFLMALYYPRLPWLNFLIFLLPLMLVMAESNTDKRLDDRLYQTVRALSETAEAAWGDEGHAGRVTNLSLEVAREVGVSEDEIHDLRFAAALHDIGRLEGGSEQEQKQRAAEMLRPIAGLERVSEIVAAQGRGPEEESERRSPLPAKIISVACAFDHLDMASPEADTEQVLSEMSLERGSLFDSVVLRALSAVLSKRRRAKGEPVREKKERAKFFEEDLETSFQEIWKDEEEE